MPTIIDYPQALARLETLGLVCNYHNSGAFGFPKNAKVEVAAYIGPQDPSIRPAAREFLRQIQPPYEENLAGLAKRFWTEHLSGDAWVMPVSHWAYELEFGSATWLPQALGDVGIDANALRPRNNGSPIAFDPSEAELFTRLTTALLQNLTASDFTLAFPAHPIVCTLHHHKQLWWVTPQTSYITILDQFAAPAR
jgi:hypothetical protein